jgi:AcrR family transcriptional regulator
MSLNRAQKKEQTRRLLINAALSQLSDERSFGSLSLREVSRQAGIAPTSFYRHFQDMDELGLTLVDEAGLTLRQLMRKARQRIESGGSAIQTSMDTFMEYVSNNQNIFRLILRERSGSSRLFRAAVSREIAHFSDELADYIQSITPCDRGFARVQADAMVALVFNAGTEALEQQSGEQRRALTRKTVLQLRMVAAGGRACLQQIEEERR